MEVIKSYNLYLNTREADYGDSNNCTFIFTTPIVLTNTNNRFRVSTPMIEMPYSFSQLNTTNYRLPFFYSDNNVTNINPTIQFPEGNFNITQLISTIIGLLVTSINANGGVLCTAANFSIVYNPVTSEITWQFVNTPTTFRSITFDFNTAFVIGPMFGYPPGSTPVMENVVPHTSPNKVMVNPITSIYIRSESLKFESNYEALVRKKPSANHNSSSRIGNYQNSDILQKIPVVSLPNSIIYFRSDVKSIITNKELGELNLYVSDNISTTYTLDLQGVNYGINVLIEEVQLLSNNAYKDRIEYLPPAVDKNLLKEREMLLQSLVNDKLRLENELKEKQDAQQKQDAEQKQDAQQNNDTAK